MQLPFIAYKWRLSKFLIALMALELPLTVACLVLFGIADGDTYRTKLWQNGYDKGFNSPPNEILYDYANYRTPHVPLIWSSLYVSLHHLRGMEPISWRMGWEDVLTRSSMVQFNIVISVFSMFLLLVKSTMYVLHAWVPLLSVFVHALELVLYAVALRNQSMPDMSDPTHPNPGLAWYLSKGCSYAETGNYGFCMQMRAAYGVTCVMV
jgi:hypothetical protein